MKKTKPKEGEYKFSDLDFEACHRAMKDYQFGWSETHQDQLLNTTELYNILKDPDEGSLYYSDGKRNGERAFVDGAILQDLYHYALRALNDDLSAFSGARNYQGLLGRLECYDLAFEKLRGLALGVDYGLRCPRDIENVTQLNNSAVLLLDAVEELAKENNINPRTGNPDND